VGKEFLIGDPQTKSILCLCEYNKCDIYCKIWYYDHTFPGLDKKNTYQYLQVAVSFESIHKYTNLQVINQDRIPRVTNNS